MTDCRGVRPKPLLLLWWDVESIADVNVVRMQQGNELPKRALKFGDARIRRILLLVTPTTYRVGGLAWSLETMTPAHGSAFSS